MDFVLIDGDGTWWVPPAHGRDVTFPSTDRNRPFDSEQRTKNFWASVGIPGQLETTIPPKATQIYPGAELVGLETRQ